MIFSPTDVSGASIVELEPHEDDRGSFARTFCVKEFAEAGLPFRVEQANLSRNRRRGTVRGLHWQAEPAPDPKIVRCTRGRIWDVAADVRRGSPTYLAWTAVELDAARGNALYVPAGCAHGFLTLEDDTEVSYLMGAPYVPELARGVRWDDEALGIDWPFPPAVVSDRDATLPTLDS